MVLVHPAHAPAWFSVTKGGYGGSAGTGVQLRVIAFKATSIPPERMRATLTPTAGTPFLAAFVVGFCLTLLSAAGIL